MINEMYNRRNAQRFIEKPVGRMELLIALQSTILATSQEQVSKEDSERVIRDNIVQIVDKEEGIIGTGLRLTTDGYILTYYGIGESVVATFDEPKTEYVSKVRAGAISAENSIECAQEIDQRCYIRDRDGIDSTLDFTFYSHSQSGTLTLLHQVPRGIPKPLKFLIAEDIQEGDDIQLLRFGDEPAQVIDYGKVTGKELIDGFKPTPFDLITNLYRDEQQRDTVVINPNTGQLAGLLSHKYKPDENESETVPFLIGVSAKSIINFLKQHIYERGNDVLDSYVRQRNKH